MSRTSMKERNKAIRQAWEKEQILVQAGKGTRDWTKEQQADILDSDKGKAYDDQGRSFVGQHMKSAAKYPEYQGDPDNIQFLTYDEHLEAHKGSWQNPTNWYFDPITKEYADFGDNAPMPCKIIDLSDPIIILESSVPEDELATDSKVTKEKEREQSDSSPLDEKVSKSKTTGTGKNTTRSTPIPKSSGAMKTPKAENAFFRGLKTVGRFIVNHPVESLEIADVVLRGTIELASAISRSHNNNSGTRTSNSGTGTSSKADIATKVADIVEKTTRAENDVSGHKQRYHTKDGVIWKDKAPYHRGGKDS